VPAPHVAQFATNMVTSHGWRKTLVVITTNEI